MNIAIGPILHALPSDDVEVWRFSIQLTVEARNADTPPVEVTSTDDGVDIAAPELVADFLDAKGWAVWRWRVAVQRGAEARTISYVVEGEGDSVTFEDVSVPALGSLPRIGMFSCNGFMHAKDGRKVKNRAKLWQTMRPPRTGHPGGPSRRPFGVPPASGRGRPGVRRREPADHGHGSRAP